MTREPQAAQDLVQDTFLHALLAWKTFRVMPGEAIRDRASAWLHRILTNQFISGCRSRIRRAEAMETYGSDIIEATVGGTSGDIAVAGGPSDADGYRDAGGREVTVIAAEQKCERLSHAVQRALADLDQDSRDIVVRVDLKGETYKEIQDDLGLSIGTVKSRLHRARKRLAEMLGADRPTLKLVAAAA